MKYKLYRYLNNMQKKFGQCFFCVLLKKPYYLEITNQLLFINFIFQRIFRLNSIAPYSVHFTSDLGGYTNIKLVGDPKEMIISIAASGNCYYAIHDGTTLEIGEGTMWAHGCTFTTGNHGLIDRQTYTKENIIIGKNCWLGSNVCMLAGAKIGDNVTVAANAVVTKEFPSNCVIGGVPAKIIKEF